MRRTRRPGSGRLVLALAGCGLMLASAGSALGAGETLGRSEHAYADHAPRGWLIINGHRCAFELRGTVELSLLRAIKQAGHHAWISDGCVVIGGRGVRITADLDGYRFTISRRGYRTVIRAELCDPEPYWQRPYRGPDRDACEPRYRARTLPHADRRCDRRSGWHHDRRGGWRWDRHRGSNCEIGLGVRIGGGRLVVRLPCD